MVEGVPGIAGASSPFSDVCEPLREWTPLTSEKELDPPATPGAGEKTAAAPVATALNLNRLPQEATDGIRRTRTQP